MARIGPLSDLICKEKVKIKTETDEVSCSSANGEVKSESFGTDIMIKVELESDEKPIVKTEIIWKDENAGEESGNYFKVEPENYEFINAYKSETVIKEEIFSKNNLNEKCVLSRNYNPQEELFTSKILEDDCSKVDSKEKSFVSDKFDKPLSHGNSKSKPHACEICGKSFASAGYLKKHKPKK